MVVTVGARAWKEKDRSSQPRESLISEFRRLVQSMYIREVPSYGNTVFYSLGFLLLITLVVLVVTGIVMVIFGPFWWDATAAGVFVRSVHYWAAEAFFVLLIWHLFVVFSTSAYRSKKLVWILGSVILLLAMLEAAFGLGLRGDFVSQWNSLSGADLWNGLGLGYWVNPLNYGALYGWHIALIPILLFGLIFAHYWLVKLKGISKPYRSDIPYTMVEADHRKLYMRGGMVVAAILVFALLFRAPYLAPMTIQRVAETNSSVLAMTLVQELNHSSGTATYLDTIDPYGFDTANVFVNVPYDSYITLSRTANEEARFYSEGRRLQSSDISAAYSYFNGGGGINTSASQRNPVIAMVSALILMARSGAYDSVLLDEQGSQFDQTYQLRLLSDTGLMDARATATGLQVDQYGMVKAGEGIWPIGTWWVAPYNLLEIAFPNGTDLQDSSAALAAFIVFLMLPYIPYLNELPDRLKLYKLIWNRFTIPEMRKGARERRKRH